jgi:hypothetical protein
MARTGEKSKYFITLFRICREMAANMAKRATGRATRAPCQSARSSAPLSCGLAASPPTVENMASCNPRSADHLRINKARPDSGIGFEEAEKRLSEINVVVYLAAEYGGSPAAQAAALTATATAAKCFGRVTVVARPEIALFQEAAAWHDDGRSRDDAGRRRRPRHTE